jgi:hypothetical protein
MARKAEVSVSSDVVAFTRREQMQRLKKFLGGKQGRSEEVVPARTGT